MTTLLLDHPDYQLTLQDGLLHLAHPDLPSLLSPLVWLAKNAQAPAQTTGPSLSQGAGADPQAGSWS